MNKSLFTALLGKWGSQQGKRSRILFLGDSVSQNSWSAFSVRLFYAGLKLKTKYTCEVSATKTECKCEGKKETRCTQDRPFRIIGQASKDVSFKAFSKYYCLKAENGFVVCLLRVYPQESPAIGQVSAMLHREAFRKGDILILNEGIHFRKSKIGDRELERIRRAVLSRKDLEELRELRIKILWRETLAQHFPTPDGTYASAQLAKITNCTPIANATFLLQRNEEVNSIMRNQGIDVIPTLRPSISDYGLHTIFTSAPHPDCTHYCLKSASLRDSSDLIAQAVYGAL